jgi:hypothetical protein
MAEAPKVPRSPRARKSTTAETAAETTTAESSSCCGDSRCPFSSLRSGIDWMNVVDDFKIAGHQNYLPRWAFVMLVLLYFAVN